MFNTVYSGIVPCNGNLRGINVNAHLYGHKIIDIVNNLRYPAWVNSSAIMVLYLIRNNTMKSFDLVQLVLTMHILYYASTDAHT